MRKRAIQSIFFTVPAPPKFDVAHAGPVTGRTSEDMELVCEAVGDDHIRQVKLKTLTRETAAEKLEIFAIH